MTREQKEILAVQDAIREYNAIYTDHTQAKGGIYAAMQAANFYGVFGLMAVRRHFGLNPDWTLPIHLSMGGQYASHQ